MVRSFPGHPATSASYIPGDGKEDGLRAASSILLPTPSAPARAPPQLHVDVLTQPVQGIGVALDRRVEPGGMRGHGPAPCLGLNQPAHLVAPALAGLPRLAELPHEGPHTPAAFEGRSFLPHLTQDSTVLPKHATKRRPVPSHRSVRGPGLNLLADFQARVPAFCFHSLEAVALPNAGAGHRGGSRGVPGGDEGQAAAGRARAYCPARAIQF